VKKRRKSPKWTAPVPYWTNPKLDISDDHRQELEMAMEKAARKWKPELGQSRRNWVDKAAELRQVNLGRADYREAKRADQQAQVDDVDAPVRSHEASVDARLDVQAIRPKIHPTLYAVLCRIHLLGETMPAACAALQASEDAVRAMMNSLMGP